MDCQDGAGENRSKVASETRLIKQPTWVFVEKESVNDLRERIHQLTGHGCHEEEEILQADLLEKLNRCKRDTLIELCRSFGVIGSRANRKEELVSFLMEFVKDQCSGIDGAYSDKKIKKRRRMKEEESLSTGKPSKKNKQDGQEDADGKNGVEDRAKYSDCDLMDNRYIYADNKKGKFPKEQTNLEPSERINGCVSEHFDGVSHSEVPNPTYEQAMITTPSKKLVTIADGDSTDVKAFKNNSSITKKKGTPKEDRKVKSCGKQESKGDTKPRKHAMKPSKEELREAVFLILDTADFATMTFGDVVKEVDKYFGKDLFERKPLIRSLIEEELFRLTEEAEKKELKEEELAEAKARAEQAAKEMSQVQTVESGIEKQYLLQASPDVKTKDSSKNTSDSTNDKGVNGGASVDSAVKRNSSDAAEGLQDHKADADTQNENVRDELTKDGKGEMVAPIANGDSAVQDSSPSNYEDETMKNSNVQILEDSKDGKVEGASNGENNDTEASRNEEGRSGDAVSNADAVNGCEAEESNNRGNDGHAEHTEDGKAPEAHNTENSINVEIHGDKDGKAKEGDINAEQSQADAGSNGKAEDDEHNANTKGDVDSGKNGAAEKGKTDDDVKANSDGDS
ncbi:uncharacterized protein C2845_PM02G23450 [Panicum miliaceum]|uniref:DEK-C domain-containing protein n=1 Tax=Panicum miliaceum TaxID=4540 RepID=A0A3L6SED4_PANMI|nr:uncharacterized protein C2845_PM02G23450 [Panicum miliaceum]